MKTTTTFLRAIVIMIALSVSNPAKAQVKTITSENVPLMDADILRNNMRKLCEEHFVWTRNVVLCIVDSLPGREQAIKRLLQNQTDIGNAVKSYYGEQAGKELTELLKFHITIGDFGQIEHPISV